MSDCEDDYRKCAECKKWYAKDDMFKVEHSCPSEFLCWKCGGANAMRNEREVEYA